MLEKEIDPTLDNVKKLIGPTFSFFTELDDRASDFKKEWSFSKRNGWIQKVHDGRKALYYFIPKHGCFHVNLTVRENELAELRSQKTFDDLKTQLEDPKKYPEGYALFFLVNDQESFSKLMKLITVLIEKRT